VVAYVTTFGGSTTLPGDLVVNRDSWYPVAPAVGSYTPIQAVGNAVPGQWICLTKTWTVTEPNVSAIDRASKIVFTHLSHQDWYFR
jgi:hypothetical protein